MPDSLSPARQIAFHQLLVGARKNWLADCLRESLKDVEANELRSELSKYVPDDASRILAAAGIRDELVFPVPVVLERTPTLVGYYRLLLGISQKRFYRTDSGMSLFKSMEERGTLSTKQRAAIPRFCAEMSEQLASLLRQMSPEVTLQDIAELPLLTLGAQFQGGNNVTIGKLATVEVFLAVAEIVADHVVERTDKRLIILNSANRRVLISLAGDPDVRIQEEFDGSLRNKVAIEIKGGTDVSNVHNRAGEAEKSHQKARGQNYRDFWTIILTRGVNVARLEEESPTTTSWFDVAQVLARSGEDWTEFKSRIAGEAGVPLAED
jgi:hypothetical protein